MKQRFADPVQNQGVEARKGRPELPEEPGIDQSLCCVLVPGLFDAHGTGKIAPRGGLDIELGRMAPAGRLQDSLYVVDGVLVQHRLDTEGVVNSESIITQLSAAVKMKLLQNREGKNGRQKRGPFRPPLCD